MWHLKRMMIIGYIILLICKYLSFFQCFEHGENDLTIPIDYSPSNQLFHKLGHLFMSPSNLSATIFIQGCQIQELRLNFWNGSTFFFPKLHNYFGKWSCHKKFPHNYAILFWLNVFRWDFKLWYANAFHPLVLMIWLCTIIWSHEHLWLVQVIWFVGLAHQGKDIVFRFIIEYSSLRVFGP
jgi:hypothetical protein